MQQALPGGAPAYIILECFSCNIHVYQNVTNVPRETIVTKFYLFSLRFGIYASCAKVANISCR